MTNLCMTLQIGATFDHPLVDLKKKKEYAIVKNNKYMYIHVQLMSLIRCIYMLKSVLHSPPKGKKHGQKNFISNSKLLPRFEGSKLSHLILVYTFWNSTRKEIGCHNSSFHVKLHGWGILAISCQMNLNISILSQE